MLQKTKKRKKASHKKKKNKITPIAKERLQKKKGQNQHGKKYKWKFLQLEEYCLNKIFNRWSQQKNERKRGTFRWRERSGDNSGGESACRARLRTWVRIPSTHIKACTDACAIIRHWVEVGDGNNGTGQLITLSKNSAGEKDKALKNRESPRALLCIGHKHRQAHLPTGHIPCPYVMN